MVGTLTQAASNLALLRSCSSEVKAWHLNSMASSAARSGLASQTATSSTGSPDFCNSLKTRAWLRPKTPTPTTATRMGFASGMSFSFYREYHIIPIQIFVLHAHYTKCASSHGDVHRREAEELAVTVDGLRGHGSDDERIRLRDSDNIEQNVRAGADLGQMAQDGEHAALVQIGEFEVAVSHVGLRSDFESAAVSRCVAHAGEPSTFGDGDGHWAIAHHAQLASVVSEKREQAA